jgi:hypothetical protein
VVYGLPSTGTVARIARYYRTDRLVSYSRPSEGESTDE